MNCAEPSMISAFFHLSSMATGVMPWSRHHLGGGSVAALSDLPEQCCCSQSQDTVVPSIAPANTDHSHAEAAFLAGKAAPNKGSRQSRDLH